MTERDIRTLIEDMSKIIENIASIAYEIGGPKFAKDIERYYLILKNEVKKHAE